MIDPRTPVLVGVGQSVDRLDSPAYHRWSAADLAAAAAESALADTGAPEAVRRAIGVIASVRTFEDSGRGSSPFGKPSNFPRSVARRLGVSPPDAVYSKAGGNAPQDLVTEFCRRVADGEYEAALICGGEATSTIRAAEAHGWQLDFSESPEDAVDDRGVGREDFVDPIAYRNGVTIPPLAYSLLETARRASLGLDRDTYAQCMGKLFAPFAAVAHANPRSAWDVPVCAPADLITPGARNRWIASPYPLRLVSRDQVNLGAALVITSVGAASRMGILEDRWVYLHGAARAVEKHLLHRPDLGTSPAARAASRAAIDQAGIDVNDVSAFDFYSCFPIAVSNIACDEFGLDADDPRRLTVTGGLPFFGGPGNNYSMHAIAEMVELLRRKSASFGLVAANGGYLSKHSAGVYSTAPTAWREPADHGLQDRLDAVPSPAVHDGFEGVGRVETFTLHFDRGEPVYGIVIGRTPQGARFIARTRQDDAGTIAAMIEQDCFGRGCRVVAGDFNVFEFV